MRYTAMVLAAVTALVLGGRALAAEEKKEEPKDGVLTLTTADNGKEVAVAKGAEFRVRLAGNPTTGFGWTVAKVEGKAVEAGKVAYERPEPAAGGPPRVGAGGFFVARFRAVAEGKSTVRMEYARPWEKDKPPAEVFTVTVTVKPEK